MKLSRLSVTLYVLLIFSSGIAIGAFCYRLYTVSTVSATTERRPEEFRKRYMREMESRLKLRPQQVNSLGAILDETRTKFHEVRERTRPELEGIRRMQVDKVKAILTEEQRTEYDKMRAERDARDKAQGRPPGPGL